LFVLDSATTEILPASFKLIILTTLHQTLDYAVADHINLDSL